MHIRKNSQGSLLIVMSSFVALKAEVDSHRQTLSQQADELTSRSERIEHVKLMIEKMRHMIFGTKSEKIVLKLEQLEFELEEQETTQAEAEAAAERVAPANKSKARSGRKPLPAHLQREETARGKTHGTM